MSETIYNSQWTGTQIDEAIGDVRENKNKWNNKSEFSGNYNDLTNKPTIPTVPTKVSAFTNDAGYITGYTETDPTVPAWAKAASKPSYTASEVGAATMEQVNGAIGEHNVDTEAHNDIRELIEQVTTGKVSVSDIVNNLTTNVSNKPLSAAQGVALKSLADAASTAAANAQSAASSKVPTSRKINGKALSADITLTADDVGAASTVTYTATIGTSWTASGSYYYQDVTVSGILATDNPVVDILPGSDNDANNLYGENICKVFRITTSANNIRLWATEAIASSFPIQLKVVR